MRHPVIVVCLLLACAHAPTSPPPAPTSEWNAPAPTPEATHAINQAWKLVDGGELGKAHALLKSTWEAGHVYPEVAWSAALAAARVGDPTASFTWVERAVRSGFADPAGLRFAKALEPVRQLPGYEALVEQATRNARAAREAAGVGSGLERISARDAGLSEPALAALVKAAEEAGSAGLVLLRHGRLVGEWYFGGESHRIETMSATKGVVALAIGLLIDEGRIPSADTPVSRFFPEWREGLAAKVTVRHLLNHTSGLDAQRSAQDIYDARDFVRHALESRVTEEPGSRFFYNNNAVNLLSGIVERASGEKLDAYLERRLFAPLGIRDFRWDKDPAGNAVGMAGLQLHPVDFAKVGQLMLQKGVWAGQRILSEAWVRECTMAAQPHAPSGGLLWWLVYEQRPTMTLVQPMLDEARANGVPEQTLAKLADLVGRPMVQDVLARALVERLGSEKALTDFESKVLRASYRMTMEGPPEGFAAMGTGGQTVLVFPEYDLVVARMADLDERVAPRAMAFPSLVTRVLDLVRPTPEAATR
ncbi:beta-lactamase family protein [Myxococcus stipitatus]|uniref:serine hydrolase domain-containing protein n=1 Tax=Myxococcus stipitatus TaxID=83455 RepID=UPI001F1665EF|nr:serine hydrolase [Myxococcus stipitatus]MCE9673211.1 beta-lactamase family protein [Myxococcus stipitatus]